MLVLSRRTGEEIIIDGKIRVTVVAVKGDRIRIGIEAPPDVVVDRAEIHARRAEFQPAAIFAGHHDDEAVPLGEVPRRYSPDDTMMH